MDDEVAATDTDDVQTLGHAKVLARTRKAFSSSDLELIYEHLGHYINSNDTLSKSEFSEYVSQVKELEGVVIKFGVNSLLVKMVRKEKIAEHENCCCMFYFLFYSSSLFLMVHILSIFQGSKKT